MGVSIFTSRKTWASASSKELNRYDMPSDELAQAAMQELLKQGHDINGLMYTGADADESEQQKRRSRRRH